MNAFLNDIREGAINMNNFNHGMKAISTNNNSNLYIADHVKKNLLYEFGIVCITEQSKDTTKERILSIGEIKSKKIQEELLRSTWEGFKNRDFSADLKGSLLYDLNKVKRKLMDEFESYLDDKRVTHENNMIDEISTFLEKRIFKLTGKKRITIKKLQQGDELLLDAIYINLTVATNNNSLKLPESTNDKSLIVNFNTFCGDSFERKGLPSVQFNESVMKVVLHMDTGEQRMHYNPFVKEDEITIFYPKLDKLMYFPMDYVHELPTNNPRLYNNHVPNGEAVICPVKIEQNGVMKKRIALVRIRVNHISDRTPIRDFEYILQNANKVAVQSHCLHGVQLYESTTELISWLRDNWALCSKSLDEVNAIRNRMYTERPTSSARSSDQREHYMRSDEAPFYKYIAEPQHVLLDLVEAMFSNWHD